ncbi:MAG: hypothetical protein JST54_09150 [Deltaproteobacteria bacterium]|nr:hypothetical protein [Deltaproteobacteria bacterium]
MLASLAMALVLAGALPETPSGAQVEWSEPNAQATYLMKQVAKDSGCHFQVIHDADQSVTWELDSCFGAKSDKKFLSPDGSRVIVVATLPAAAGKQAEDWPDSTVVWLFEKGRPVGFATAKQLVKDGTAVRREVSHFNWLQGANGVPGVPPRYNDAGDAVELDAIDGTHSQLRFEGFKLPATLMKRPKKKRHY